MPNGANSVVDRPAMFRGLGNLDPPPAIAVGGCSYRREIIFKHDSWAATALYRDVHGSRVTCKFNRQAPIFGLPMKWLGRRLARREAWFLRQLSGLEIAPDDMGAVYVDGVLQEHAVARRFIPGAPLLKHQRVQDDFFPRLFASLRSMREKGIAYVDLNKKENIVVGEDGRPYLVDFQISFRLPTGRFGKTRLLRAIHSQLCEIDHYHALKHLAHCRPDLANSEELRRARTPPRAIRIYRVPANLLRYLRRRLLVLIGVRSGSGLAHTESNPEDAVRRTMQSAARDGKSAAHGDRELVS